MTEQTRRLSSSGSPRGWQDGPAQASCCSMPGIDAACAHAPDQQRSNPDSARGRRPQTRTALQRLCLLLILLVCRPGPALGGKVRHLTVL